MAYKKKGNWGGRRKGAGRKMSEEPTMDKLVAFRVTEDTNRKAKALREITKGDEKTFNQMFREWVDAIAQDYGVE